MNQEEAARLRMEYEAEGLVEERMAPDPFAEFEAWLAAVLTVDLPEPNTMMLATVDPDGRPSARAVLMKGFSNQGVVFYTNLNSRKSKALHHNGMAAATFVWIPLHRQVRFEGTVGEVGPAIADAYFSSRPRGAQIAAHASNQSEVVSREELETAYERVEAKYGEGEVPRPSDWGGWRLTPDVVEFWQGRPHRFHDRVRYRRDETGHWHKERLAP